MEAWAKRELELEETKAPTALWEKGGAVGFLKVEGALFLIFLVCSFIQIDGTAGVKVLAAVGFTVGMLLVFLTVSWFSRRNVGKRYRRLLVGPREVYFGDEGVFCDGEYVQWTMSGDYLTAARVTHAPEQVELVFQTFNGSAALRVTRRAPIPAGRGSDLEVIQQRLSVVCPKAAVQIA